MKTFQLHLHGLKLVLQCFMYLIQDISITNNILQVFIF